MFQKENSNILLSRISQDSPTHLDHFDPKVTPLRKYDFIVPGRGLKPSYCGKPHVNGIADDGSGAHVIFTHCKKMECPDCADLWRLQRVFENTVKIEAYAKYSGTRPCKGDFSIGPYQEFTLDAIRKFNRNGKMRLKRQGMHAGMTVFHAFRIIKVVNKVITKLTGDSSSSGHWNYILNEDNIPVLDKHLPFKVKSWYDLVYLGPHNHFIGFPGNILVTGDKKGKIIIKKEPLKVNGVEIWELENVESVFSYVMYLSSHVSQLDNGSKNHILPYLPFGELSKMKLLDLVSPEELQEIEASVLELINRRRTQKFDIKDGKLVYAVSDQEEKVNFIPISHFRYRSIEGQENAKKLIDYVSQFCPANAEYLTYMIRLYNCVLASRDVPFKFRRLFLAPLECEYEDMPSFVKDLDDQNPVKKMFIEGLKAPPDSFNFYFNGYLSEKEKQYKDKFNTSYKIDNKGLEKPEFINPDIEDDIMVVQAVKPDIKIDEEFIKRMEKKFLQLSSNRYACA